MPSPDTLVRLGSIALLLLSLGSPALAQQPTAGRIEGSITDSVRAAPLAGARVWATRLGAEPESALVATTDAQGRFRFDRAIPGDYSVSFESALLDSLTFGGPAPSVTVHSGSVARLALAIPSGATLRRVACPGVSFQPRTGVLVGRVLDADSDAPLVYARVTVGWNELRVDTLARRVGTEDRATQVRTDSGGQYRLCGVPTNEWLHVQIQKGEHAGSVSRTMIADAVGVRMLDLSFSSGGAMPLAAAAPSSDTTPARTDTATVRLLTGRAVLTGVVRREGGLPVAGAQVRVMFAEPTARTNDSGRFVLSGLPAGTHELEVRRIGYAVARASVELRNDRTLRRDVQLERAVSLDSVAVVAKRMLNPEFEYHRQRFGFGDFLDEEEIKQRGFLTAAHIIGTMSGFKIGFDAGGRIIPVKMSHATFCPNVGLRSTHPGGYNIVIDNLQHNDIGGIPPLVHIAAIEAYAHGCFAPHKYDRADYVIVIWTKAGRGRQVAPKSNVARASRP